MFLCLAFAGGLFHPHSNNFYVVHHDIQHFLCNLTPKTTQTIKRECKKHWIATVQGKQKCAYKSTRGPKEVTSLNWFQEIQRYKNTKCVQWLCKSSLLTMTARVVKSHAVKFGHFVITFILIFPVFRPWLLTKMSVFVLCIIIRH